MAGPLSGAGIVVTRPSGRGESLCERIESLGGDAFFFPAVDIHAVTDVHKPAAAPDWLIFASVAAVEHGLAQVPAFPGHPVRIAAIGAATSAALADAGRHVDVVPAQQESEGLLAHPALQAMAGSRVWIVRGRGGRNLLADGLRARGADVHFIEVYERHPPAAGIEPLLQRWRDGRVDAMVVTSRALLESLHAVLDTEGRHHLARTQLVMPTERMLKLALELDIRPAPILATSASDDALLAALVNWWRTRRQDLR